MADISETSEAAPEKGGKVLFLITALAMILGIAGGGWVNMSGIISSGMSEPTFEEAAISQDAAMPAFVMLDPIVVSLKDGDERFLLKFVGSLDVTPQSLTEVEALKPRIADIINGYLRALELEDFEKPAALLQIRSHLLHRVRLVAGENRIKDLLVIEFVIN